MVLLELSFVAFRVVLVVVLAALLPPAVTAAAAAAVEEAAVGSVTLLQLLGWCGAPFCAHKSSDR